MKSLTGPEGPPKPVDYGIKADFIPLGSFFDPDINMPGLTHQKQLEVTNRVSRFIRALFDYILEYLEIVVCENPGNSLDNVESEVVVTVPSIWSEKTRVAITQVSLS